jgi:hypothetical protein
MCLDERSKNCGAIQLLRKGKVQQVKGGLGMTKKIGYQLIGIVLLIVFSFGLNACTKQATMTETGLKQMTPKEHGEKFPKGHPDGGSITCYYDEVGDMYYCPY